MKAGVREKEGSFRHDKREFHQAREKKGEKERK